MHISDLVILGRACPEPLKDGRVTVCLAGCSESLGGFVRLYPTRHDMSFKRWDVIEVDVERNERDTRHESWKISGSKSEWETLSEKASVVGSVKSSQERRRIINDLKDTCVTEINDSKRSLGIVKPKIIKTYFKENAKYGQLFQKGLPGFTQLDDVQVKRDYPQEPRVTYECTEGGSSAKRRDQQILEWGFYEWFRKNPENISQVWENAGFNNHATDLYFLVGNLFAYRNSFMVISVLRVPAIDATQHSMFPIRKSHDD